MLFGREIFFYRRELDLSLINLENLSSKDAFRLKSAKSV